MLRSELVQHRVWIQWNRTQGVPVCLKHDLKIIVRPNQMRFEPMGSLSTLQRALNNYFMVLFAVGARNQWRLNPRGPRPETTLHYVIVVEFENAMIAAIKPRWLQRHPNELWEDPQIFPNKSGKNQEKSQTMFKTMFEKKLSTIFCSRLVLEFNEVEPKGPQSVWSML